jgi:tetratricopeptide (TPR) repeat protein
MDIKKEREQLLKLESLVYSGRETEALNIIEKVKDEFSDSFQIKFIKAKVLIELEKYVSAEEILRELERNNKDNLNLLRLFSDLYIKIGKKEISLEYLNKIIFIDPFNSEIKDKINNLKIQIKRQKTSQADTIQEVNFEEYEEQEPNEEPSLVREKDVIEETYIESKNYVNSELEDQEQENIVKDELSVVKEVVKEDAVVDEYVNNDEDEFNTLSAAAIYIKQGLHKDALIILENIYRKNKDEKVLEMILNLKKRIKSIKKIKVLNYFMDTIKKKEADLV